mmetsp:Transcript_6674/g.20821  ORF Transcript_6674/g.20821 Transcript_6674/m.20821 type:complete len:215 (+) Transcript_6674:127-771(+)
MGTTSIAKLLTGRPLCLSIRRSLPGRLSCLIFVSLSSNMRSSSIHKAAPLSPSRNSPEKLPGTPIIFMPLDLSMKPVMTAWASWARATNSKMRFNTKCSSSAPAAITSSRCSDDWRGQKTGFARPSLVWIVSAYSTIRVFNCKMRGLIVFHRKSASKSTARPSLRRSTSDFCSKRGRNTASKKVSFPVAQNANSKPSLSWSSTRKGKVSTNSRT